MRREHRVLYRRWFHQLMSRSPSVDRAWLHYGPPGTVELYATVRTVDGGHHYYGHPTVLTWLDYEVRRAYPRLFDINTLTILLTVQIQGRPPHVLGGGP